MDQSKFLSKLFEPGQHTCFATTPYDTAISAAHSPPTGSQWFSINALHTSRADENVLCYRNFLLEVDNMPLTQQIQAVRDKLPVTAITFSGGKSYHFIVSLAEPVTTETDYRRVWRGLHEAVPFADKSTKNPSRLSRLPAVLRQDTGLIQELVYLGDRIPLAELPKPSAYREPQAASVDRVFVSQLLLTAVENPDAYIALHFSGRNQFFYWVGKRCSELKHSREQKKAVVDTIYNRLENKKNFSIREAYAAARVKWI